MICLMSLKFKLYLKFIWFRPDWFNVRTSTFSVQISSVSEDLFELISLLVRSSFFVFNRRSAGWIVPVCTSIYMLCPCAGVMQHKTYHMRFCLYIDLIWNLFFEWNQCANKWSLWYVYIWIYSSYVLFLSEIDKNIAPSC